ncbi:MAG: peptidylprolyl isomerase [Rhodomicrobium sp.]
MNAVFVNSIEIPEAAIAAEMQHHPAASKEASLQSAARALMVRALLIARAEELGLVPAPETDANGKRETNEDALIRQLLECEVKVPEPDEESCARYYQNNRERFRSPEIFEASHILFGAAPSSAKAYAEAAGQAESIIDALRREPDRFEELARTLSTCPSAAQGGNLGQITRGQTTPEFETFLFSLEGGQLCPVPVKTGYGVHIVKLHRRIKGNLLPFAAVKDRIAAFLSESVWRSAVAQYIGLLVANADIRGLEPNAMSAS